MTGIRRRGNRALGSSIRWGSKRSPPVFHARSAATFGLEHWRRPLGEQVSATNENCLGRTDAKKKQAGSAISYYLYV